MRFPYFFMVILFLLAALFSCVASPASKTATEPITSQAIPADKAPSSPISEWYKVIALAKREGKVSVYTSTIPGNAFRGLSDAFKEKYGITVEFISGRGAELMQKIITEQRAGVNLADVYETGSATHILLKQRGYLEGPIIVPEAADTARFWFSNPWEIDPEKYLFSYYEYTPGPVINTNLVRPPEEPKSWFDLLEPKWKGKIMWDDPTVPGPGVKTLHFLRQYVGGMEYWEKLAKQEVIFIRDRQFLFDSIALGRTSIALGVFTTAITRGLKDGAPIKALWLKEGGPGAGWAVSLLKNAPHPNAAKVFLNWFLSREGQLIFSKGGEVPSFRKDVPQEHVNPQFRVTAETKIKYWTSEDEERQRNDQTLAAEFFKIGR